MYTTWRHIKGGGPTWAGLGIGLVVGFIIRHYGGNMVITMIVFGTIWALGFVIDLLTSHS